MFLKRFFWIVLLSSQYAAAQHFTPLFNGKNLKGWSTMLKTKARNNDPAKVFTVDSGLLHITGEEVGYIVTDKIYTDFHLVVEFKWGKKKWPPRENRPRDNGILYFVSRDDKVWPTAVECQLQEGDCGDMWLLDSITAVVNGVQSTPGSYARYLKKKDNEKPSGEWNRVEVISKDGKVRHIVNGEVVNEAENISVRSGKIAIQSEMAETYFRKIEIKEL